jgi:GcrA cell cycle regulator
MSIATWTPERIEQLRTCVDTGLTCSQIAATIGVTRNAVIGKINRLGLSAGRTAGTVRACPPRARRPRLLRLVFSQVPSIAEDIDTGTVESAQPRSLLDLAQGTCRWPVGDPNDADFAFCGNAALGGFSYCVGHARMAYRSPARRRA